MTASNTNNLDVLFQDISVEDTANISGGESIISFGSASASFKNNTGGIALTSVRTSSEDQGTHTGTSDSSSLSVAFNDNNNAPRVGGQGSQLNVDGFVNGLLGV